VDDGLLQDDEDVASDVDVMPVPEPVIRARENLRVPKLPRRVLIR
jgi:hypothetical protein